MKRTLVRILTATIPLKVLRKIYIAYSYVAAQLRYGDWRFPRIISIEISTHCNRACSYCPNVIYPQKPRLIKQEVIEKIISRIGEIRYSGVVDFIFFSEPTLNPKLPEYVAMVKKAAPRCIPRICTNGDLLNSENVKALVDAGLDRIYVMRHNPTPEGWRENIEALAKEFPGVFVRMDIDEVERVEGLHDFNGLLEVKKHRGRHIVDGRARCQVHRHVAQFTVDGDWNLCCVDYAKTKSFGNLIPSSIMEIWNSPGFVRSRYMLEDGAPATSTCKTCTCLVERAPEHQRRDFVPRGAEPRRVFI
jgi:MoaA/NifB/PqqE/SkfB family radical SAM enzyme